MVVYHEQIMENKLCFFGTHIALGLSLLVLLMIFSPFEAIFFAQDDFFLLAISRARTFSEWIAFFIPRSDVVWYRPLSQQFFFGFTQSLAGLNPVVFHNLLLGTHVLNSLLLFAFIFYLTKRSIASVLGTIVYLFHSLHFLSLAWPAAYGFLLGPTFFLLTFNGFIRWVKCSQGKWLFFTWVAFCLSILTVEVNLFLPLLLCLIVIFFPTRDNNQRKIIVINLGLFFGLSISLILFRTVIFKPQHVGEQYIFSLGQYLIPTIWWYSLRLLGLVQSYRLADQLNFYGLAVGFYLFITMGLVIPTWRIVSLREWNKLHTLSLCIIIIGMVPFLLLPEHRSPHYLSFSAIGLSLYFSLCIIAVKEQYFISCLMVTIIIFISFLSFMTEFKTHWIIKRSMLARALISSGVYTVPTVSEAYFALGANYAQKVYTPTN